MTRLVLVGLFFGACTADVEVLEDLDPAGTNGDEQWSDEGPLEQDVASDVDDVEVTIPEDEITTIAAGRPLFQLPFPCGQVWAGQTRTNHSPQRSVDFNRLNDLGDSVVAAAGGTVTRVANEGNVSYGRWIEIAHGAGWRTRYAHLSSQLVHVGQVVHKGQLIGKVGSTGGSTGPHLHFEERLNGAAVSADFNGRGALYFGTKNYTSQNSCGGGGGNSVVGRVNTAGAPLTKRAGTSTSTAAVGSVADGATVTITCQKRGQSITGTYGTSTLWDHISGGYIADAYVSTGSDGQVAPTCP
ncbi:MAG TPA: peptidoglycan DD-metalloendopeptidase family protein [Kofleriaceae bacterium]|nr:peptidoglycan DD-metalloendopeptidase family protein [Kofleriaceae bacterium]